MELNLEIIFYGPIYHNNSKLSTLQRKSKVSAIHTIDIPKECPSLQAQVNCEEVEVVVFRTYIIIASSTITTVSDIYATLANNITYQLKKGTFLLVLQLTLLLTKTKTSQAVFSLEHQPLTLW